MQDQAGTAVSSPSCLPSQVSPDSSGVNHQEIALHRPIMRAGSPEVAGSVTPNKACPVIFRGAGPRVELLAFRHPIAGCQLVKGTIEPGESPEHAALRELAEEAGVLTARIERHIGIWQSGWLGQVWSFFACKADAPLPEAWSHDAPDDGGHTFRFFWHPLWAPAQQDQWHMVFRDALRFIQGTA